MKSLALPQNMVPGMQPNEQVCLVLRQHVVVLGLKLLTWLIFVAILVLGQVLVPRLVPGILGPTYAELWLLVKTVYLMLLALGLLIIWVLYYLNVQIVTNERIVDIDQRSLLDHEISELHLNQVQDVTAEIKGVLPTIFNFGDVYIQTAGVVGRFVFHRIPNPVAVSKLISDLYEQLPEEEKQRGRLSR